MNIPDPFTDYLIEQAAEAARAAHLEYLDLIS